MWIHQMSIKGIQEKAQLGEERIGQKNEISPY